MTTEKTKQTLADAMTAQDVAGRMGYSIDYFYVLCREGKIPHHQPNGPKRALSFLAPASA